MKSVNIPLTIPNILSLYRLFSFPFILIFVILGHQNLFIFFIWFNLTTDILDGWIARKFNQTTEIGAKIDGLADSGTYILALIGIITFKWTYFQPYIVTFFLFSGLFIFSRLFSFYKLGIFSGFHTYGAKIAGYIHGLFFITLFVSGFYQWFYYILLFSGFIVFVENILLTIIMEEPTPNIKGLYWELKRRNMKKAI